MTRSATLHAPHARMPNRRTKIKIMTHFKQRREPNHRKLAPGGYKIASYHVVDGRERGVGGQ